MISDGVLASEAATPDFQYYIVVPRKVEDSRDSIVEGPDPLSHRVIFLLGTG